ncbi:MAG: hypothetical protein FJ386_05925 [Verrucomicrobia bacterium]|nr:hypothetical protein [Verrucomicrobiota bacterium]
MSTTPTPSDPSSGSTGQPAPAATSTPTTGQSAAEQFIADQLAKARASLRRTQIAGLIASLIVLGYMSFVTSRILEWLDPKTAADYVTLFVNNEVQEKATDLAGELKQKIPELVRQIPTLVMDQIPLIREELESKVEQDLRQFCATTSVQMGKHLDLYLENNAAKIRAVLNATQDRESIKQLGPDIEQTIMDYLAEKTEDGESIKDKIDKTLEALHRVEAHTDRLAKAKGLTPQETKTRRIIAILGKAADGTDLGTSKDNTVVTDPALPLPKKPKSEPKK